METRFALEPKVRVTAKMVFDVAGLTEFLEANHVEWPELTRKLGECVDLGDKDGEWLVQLAHRISCSSDSNRADAQDGDPSPLHHAMWAMTIWGISKTSAVTIVQSDPGIAHSMAPATPDSANGAGFKIPLTLQKIAETHPDLLQAWKDHMERSADLYGRIYQAAMEDGLGKTRAQNAARSVLSSSVEVLLILTCSAGSLRRMFNRLGDGGYRKDLDLRRIMTNLLRAVQSESQSLFLDYCVSRHPDGSEYVRHEVVE